MATIAEKIQIAKLCGMLSANELSSGKVVGNTLDKRLPELIHLVRRGLEYSYEDAPDSADTLFISNYLISICRHQYRAEAIVSGGGGGSSSVVIMAQKFPIKITEVNFTSDVFYPNTNIFGNNIVIYVNEINQYVFNGVGFTVDETGITMLIPGFDATVNTYNLIIEKVY